MRRKQRDIGMFQSEQGCEVLWYLVPERKFIISTDFNVQHDAWLVETR
jgi:hypothetical protein